MTDIGKKIGFLSQNVGYYPNFTAKKTIEYFGYLRGVNKKELDSNVEQVLRDVNLYENRNDKVKSFSGGMKQRLGIAITCVANPEIIIFLTSRQWDLIRKKGQDLKI